LNHSSPLIANCILINNTSVFGGGVYCHKYSNPIIKKCFVKNNTAYDGAGIYLENKCDIELINSVVSYNSSYMFAGGIRISNCTPFLINNIIDNNYAPAIGGGVTCDSCYSTFLNCLFIGNKSERGGALSCLSSDVSIKIINTILWSNEASVSGNEIQINGGHVEIHHSIVKEGIKSIEINGGTLIWGGSIIDQDPVFAAPTQGDYHILIGSPCIDSGDKNVEGLLELDFEGDVREAYGGIDIGPDEFYPHLYFTGDAISGGYLQIKAIGLPWSSPLILFFGSDLLESPMNTIFGDWYLQAPIVPIDLDLVPMNSIKIIEGNIPQEPCSRYYLQALIGAELSNKLCINIDGAVIRR